MAQDYYKAPFAVWRRHRCGRSHRTPETFLRCAIPRLAWVTGQGRMAVIAWCRTPTATLWDSHDEAFKALEFIDSFGCGGGCHRRHQVVAVEGVL